MKNGLEQATVAISHGVNGTPRERRPAGDAVGRGGAGYGVRSGRLGKPMEKHRAARRRTCAGGASALGLRRAHHHLHSFYWEEEHEGVRGPDSRLAAEPDRRGRRRATHFPPRGSRSGRPMWVAAVPSDVSAAALLSLT